VCSEKALKPVQTWFVGFSAMHHYTTKHHTMQGHHHP